MDTSLDESHRKSVAESPSVSSTTSSPESSSQSPKPRKTTKFFSLHRDRKFSSSPSVATDTSLELGSDYPSSLSKLHRPLSPTSLRPEPFSSRTHSERPAASTLEVQSLYSSTSSPSRVGDLPTRLGGWFAHTFASSTDLSLPSILAQHTSPSSPPRTNLSIDSSLTSPRKIAGPAALIAVAKHGKGTLDKAMRYLLDSDAAPDKSPEPIWIMGVMHPGWQPQDMEDTGVRPKKEGKIGRGRAASWRSSFNSTSSSSSTEVRNPLSSSTNSPSRAHGSTSAKSATAPPLHWPPAFYLDFRSRVWLTYRSHFATPIRDISLAELEQTADSDPALPKSISDSRGTQIPNEAHEGKSLAMIKKPWNWGAEKTWSSDSGWGCMLRTGQSLLANTLVEVHLGREWRRLAHPEATADYAMYVRILTWFLDSPAPHAPFSVHRMALAGKELGTDVGQWFGPSVAAGAIKTLVNSFPECGIGVALATDSTLYENEVFAASHKDSIRSPKRLQPTSWGERPVLLLFGIRLGIEGVNPIYYDSIKMLYTFPQSVGIAGGRPSSSYYFVGTQAEYLFYLDPHNSRPAIPLRQPPLPVTRRDSGMQSDVAQKTEQRSVNGIQGSRRGRNSLVPTVPPSPLHRQISRSSMGSLASNSQVPSIHTEPDASGVGAGCVDEVDDEIEVDDARRPPPLYEQREVHRVVCAAPPLQNPPVDSTEVLSPVQLHYCNAYSTAEIETFHCDRVRKMPLSGLDPSMLIGFLCRDESDWHDFRRRVSELPKAIFAIENEPPAWPSDSDDDMGFESMSGSERLGTDQDEHLIQDDVEADVDTDVNATHGQIEVEMK